MKSISISDFSTHLLNIKEICHYLICHHFISRNISPKYLTSRLSLVPEKDIPLTELVIQEGDTVTLDCDSEYEVKWMLDDKPLTPGSK